MVGFWVRCGQDNRSQIKCKERHPASVLCSESERGSIRRALVSSSTVYESCSPAHVIVCVLMCGLFEAGKESQRTWSPSAHSVLLSTLSICLMYATLVFCPRWCLLNVGKAWKNSLVGSTELLITELMQAASRRTTNSKPSLDMSVMYLLGSWLWLEEAIVGWFEVVDGWWWWRRESEDLGRRDFCGPGHRPARTERFGGFS